MDVQKRYLQLLSNICAVPIQVSKLERKKNGEYKPGYRKDIKFFQSCDDRTVSINEIVFDFDFNSYTKNYKIAKKVLDVLDDYNIKSLIFATGGKGIHIHIFFDKITLYDKDHKSLLREAFSYGLTWKKIRLWLWEKIIEEANIDIKLCGKGKKIDSAPISFNYFSGTSHLIRCCGGRKKFKNKDDIFEVNYKSYIPINEFNDKKVKVKNIQNVRYPDNIQLFKIPQDDFVSFVSNYAENVKKSDFVPTKNVYLPCDYTEIDGVLKIKEGLGQGQRSFGSLVLSIACKIDRFTKTQATEILKEYVNNCSQTGHKFNLDEAIQWLDWIYAQEAVFWNCSMLDDLDLHDKKACEFCTSKNKKALEFLKQPTLLRQIKNTLDEEIIGEDDTKMIIFLLSLSKDFPSETGEPNWNIPGDPMSQNIILASDSSSGKTYITKKILKIFGEESDDFFIISRLTKNSINYYTDINMDKKIIFIEEMQGLDDNTSQLRVWMSEGKLVLSTVEKIRNDEGIEVNMLVKKETKGQPVFITCQAEGVVQEQLNNRSWIISMDVTQNQTEKILDYQDKLNKGELSLDNNKIQILKDSLKQLHQYHFMIPFLDWKILNIPINDIRARRDYNKFLTLIKCSAYLHQYQREIKKNNNKEYLICDLKDYEIARQYSTSILGAVFSGLTISQIDLINTIRNSPWKEEFTIQDIQRNLQKTQSHWYYQLRQLEDLGYIMAIEKSIGKSTIYSLNEKKALNIIQLPSAEDLKKNSPYFQVSNSNYIKNEKNEKKNSSVNGRAQLKGFKNNTLEQRSENINPANMENGTAPESILPPYTPRILRGPEQVIEFIKNSKNHIIYVEDIISNFSDVKEDIIENVLSKLKSQGIIFEPKPGRVMLL